MVYLKSIQEGSIMPLEDMHVASEEELIRDSGMENKIMDLTILA